MHFAYPNINTRHKETIFIGCGRFVAAPESPGADYHDAAPKLTHSLEILFEAAAHFAPEALENHCRVYEKQDQPGQAYQGNSMGLAYLLALISRARRFALTDAPGDIWSTGEIVRQPHSETRFFLRPVAHADFQKKLEAFLAPDNPDHLFLAPFANIADQYDALSRRINVLRVTKGRSLAPEQLRSAKTIALIDETELQQVIDLLFIAPAGQQPKPQTRARLRRPATYTTYPRYDYFVGRDDLKRQVIAELRGNEKVTCMVNDIGGIGKTALASEIVTAIGAEFAGVYYTKCTPDTDADALLAELAYFLAEQGDSTVAEVFEYAAQQGPKINALIAALNARRYLLLFDDLHDTLNKATCEILRPDLKTFFDDIVTQAHQSKLFFISRTQPIIPSGQARQAKHKLGPLDREAGITLLRHCGVQAAPELLERAYEFTQGHPVSMKLLATLIETTPLRTILADHQHFWNAPEVANDLLRRIYQTTLADEQNVLFQMAVLPHPVTNAVIYALDGRPETPQLLKNLVRKSLVLYDPQNELYRLHDVIRDFQRSQLTGEQKQAYHLKAATYYERQEFNAELPTFAQVQNRLEARYHYFQAGEIDKAAQLLLDISEFYRIWGYLQQCKNLIQETQKRLESFTPTTERQMLIIDMSVEQSWIERSVNSFDKAIECCKLSENLLNIVTSPKHVGNVYHALGNFLYEQGDWNQSHLYLMRSFEMQKQANNIKGLAKVIVDLYVWYWEVGKVEPLEIILEDAIETCKQKGDRENHAEIIVNALGPLLQNQGRFDEALAVFEESLALRKADNFYGKANSLRMIGQTLFQKRNFRKALIRYEEGLVFAQKSQDDIMQAYILREIGDTYRDDWKIEDAIKYYLIAHKIAEKSENLSGKITAFSRLGFSYGRTDKIDEALQYYQKFRYLYQELGDNIGDTDGLDSLGDLYLRRYSDLGIALRHYQESIAIRKKIGRLLKIGTEMNSLALVYIEQGKLNKALKILEWLRMKEKQRIGTIIDNLNYTGVIYRLQGKYEEALETHLKSLNIYEKAKRFDSGKAIILNYLGEDYLTLDEFGKAFNCLKESLQRQPLFYKKAEPMTNIADVYFRQGKLAEALTTCEESLALSRTYGGRIQAGVTLHLMAKIRQQEQRPADALPYIQEAVTIFRETGSRHLADAERTLQAIQERMNEQENTS